MHASAHGPSRLDDSNLLGQWTFTPEITIPILLTVIVYTRGWWKRLVAGKPPAIWQSIAFLGGMLCFFIALQSPIEPLSDHFLFIHQIEHLLLRVFGPLLTILGAPLAPLIQGLPRSVRFYLLAPLLRNRLMKRLYQFLSHPITAPFLFIAVLLLWQIPSLHDRAVQNPTLHNLMHVTMIFSGFFFWWLIADPRGHAAKLSHPFRLIVLWIVTIPNTLLGAYITLNTSTLYHVYDVLEGRWHLDRLDDQHLGGILIWGPGSMMGVIGTAVIFLLWMREEQRSNPAPRETQAGMPAA